MKTTTRMMIAVALGLLFSGTGVARADVVVGVSGTVEVSPAVPVPVYVPAAPPVAPPLAPLQARAVAPALQVVTEAGGQWVYTGQYGWVYMPYGAQYVYTQSAGAYAYVYYPTFGWRWLAAPWILGSGPHPYFGARGPFAYAWYRGLHRARHPWAGYLAHNRSTHGGTAHDRPWVGRAAASALPRRVASSAPTRPRVPARATVPPPARVTAPARPARRPGITAHHGPGAASGGAVLARGNPGNARGRR